MDYDILLNSIVTYDLVVQRLLLSQGLTYFYVGF